MFCVCVCVFHAVVEEVWKQQTLLQLLQIVDLPVLDCILSTPVRTERHHSAPLRSHNDLVISNTCVEREVTQSLNLPELVPVSLSLSLCADAFAGCRSAYQGI